MQLRLTYYRKQILYQYKVYYNISDPEEDQGCTSNEIQNKAIELLAKIKAERAGKEFVRIPLESGHGYYEIEKSKYEKRQRQK